MDRKKSIAVIALAVLMSLIAVIFLFFDNSTKPSSSEISTQVQENVVPSIQTTPNSPTPTSEDVLLESPEDFLPAEDDSVLIKGGEGEELQLDTNF